MHYKEMLSLLDQQERDIATHAEYLANEFWHSHYSGNAERDKSERSALGLRVRYRADTGSLEAAWNRLYWVKDKEGKTHLRSEHIRKGASSHSYSEAKLLRFAQKWERDVVLEVERGLAALREEFTAIRKARVSLRKAYKVAAQGRIGSTNKESESTDE